MDYSAHAKSAYIFWNLISNQSVIIVVPYVRYYGAGSRSKGNASV